MEKSAASEMYGWIVLNSDGRGCRIYTENNYRSRRLEADVSLSCSRRRRGGYSVSIPVLKQSVYITVNAPKLRSYFAVLILVTVLEPSSGSPLGCPDLSGHYRFFGTWEYQNTEGAKPEAKAAYNAANPEPRLDRFALGLYTGNFTDPSVAALRQDLATDVLEIDVTGDSIPRWVGEPAPKLPARVSMTCNGSEWLLERITRAGGENTVSKEHERILLWVDSNGDLLAKGHSDLTKGWIFKKKISSDWLARFRRTNEIRNIDGGR